MSPAIEQRLVAEFAAEVRRDLALEPKQLQSKYLYDALGSSLFDAICRLPWYRITRGEMRLLARHAGAVVGALGQRDGKIVELGCGSGEKLMVLAEALERRAREMRDELKFLLRAGDPSYVYFVETRGRGIFLRAAPIDVSSIVRELLLDRMRATVLTSATLTVDGTFTYIKSDATELPALYEVKDGKPAMLNFQVNAGTYVVPKVLERGYLALGNVRLEFEPWER